MKFKPRITPAQGFSLLESTGRSQVATLVLHSEEAFGGPHSELSSADQWLYVISGEGRAVVGGEVLELGPGTLLLIEAGETREINNVGERPLEILNFYAPPAY